MRNNSYSIWKNKFGGHLTSRIRTSFSTEKDAAEAIAAALHGHEDPNMHPQKGGGIEVEENKIYFYSEVAEKEALELNKILRHLDVEMDYLKNRLDLQQPPPIRLFIHSPGGSFFSALSIIDTIESCKSPIYTYIDGHAASAATLISVVGDKRYATKNAFMLIHQQRMTWEGKYAEFIDEIENQKHVTETMHRIYLEKTKMSREELDTILKKELHIPAKECLKLGLIDEII